MKTAIITLFVALLLSISFQIYSQSGVKIKESKLYNITEIGYGHGLGKIKFKDVGIKVDNKGHYFRVRTQFGYFLSKQFSLGVGIGLDGYHDFTFNTAPVFLDGRYYFRNQPQTFFILANLGYALPLASNFEKGILSGFAIGRKMSSERLIFLPSIGLNVQQLQDINYFFFNNGGGSGHGDNISIASLQINFGLLF